jgi:6-phospho-beta-glucosidase
VKAGDRDVTGEVIGDSGKLKAVSEDNYYWVTGDLLVMIGGMPNPYLKYYADTAGELTRQKQRGLRSAQVLEAELRALAIFAESDSWGDYRSYLELRGGEGYSGAALDTLLGLAGIEDTRVTLNVRNDGKYPFLADECSVEIPVGFDNGRTVEDPGWTIGEWLPELAKRIDTYESLLIGGIVERDRSLLEGAAETHPLIGPLELEYPELN